MEKKYRKIFLPFSFLYHGIIHLRNLAFDKKIFRSASFDLPVICIGNLSVGGTGKSPMVEYLVRLLHKKYKVATLSRGYKRKTKGFYIADENTITADIGDEPMQFYRKFRDITVAVDEDRVMGIPKILNDRPETEIIILDDAFQHRQVVSGLNILLTACDNLYTKDFLLPAGSLRDEKKSSRRADIIVVTKCNKNLSRQQRQQVIEELNPGHGQKVFFTTIQYGTPYSLFANETRELNRNDSVLLVTGIADPALMEMHVGSEVFSKKTLRFKDHHVYNEYDIKKIKDEFAALNSSQKIMLTTEKDAARLSSFKIELKDLAVFVLPMAHQFLFDETNSFENVVMEYIRSTKFNQR
jgi:tetraacyldisaccharide 4'-kinase